MRTLCIIFIVYFGFLPNVFGQIGLNILEGPNKLMPCDSNCIMLHATYPKQLKTNQYSITSIPSSPISVSSTNLTLQDDKFSSSVPLGFSFCFFEQVYTNCYISDNGILTFNPLYANSPCYNNTQQLFPYFNSTCPDNAIFGLFMDLAPSQGGSISYATTGSAPFRKFVVTYQGLKLFGASCSSATANFQIVLNETTNIIEVFITNKPVCNSLTTNTTNYSTVGIQNLGATTAFTAAGKHASIFTANNEGIRIAPSGSINYTMTWNNAFNQVIATNIDSVNFCPPYYPYNQVVAKVSYTCPPANFSDTIRFTKNAPSIANTTIIKPNCAGSLTGSILINGAGVAPFTYSFANGPFTSNNQFNGLGPGSYLITIKDANGCKKDTIIPLLPLVSIVVVLDTIIKPTCPLSNGSITVHATGGTSPYTYVWTNGTTGPTINNISAGNYVVTAIDANGCSNQVSITVQNQGLPILTAIKSNPLCGNLNGFINLNVSGGTPPYSFQWTGLGTSQNLSNLGAGQYTVLVTDINGCQESKVYQLVDTLQILNNKYVEHTKCGLANGKITINAYNGLAPYSYAWTPSGQTTNVATNLQPGTHIVTISTSNGCTKIDSAVILPSLATINQLTFANANCDLDNGLISLNGVQNFNGTYSTLWSTGFTGNSIAGLSPGTYWVETTDILGCKATDTITIQNDGKPILGILSYTEPRCFGDSTGSVTLSGSQGVGPYKYSLDGINYSSIAQLDSIPGGTITIFITDANSCLNDTLITFNQPTEIKLSYISDTIICFNDSSASLSLSASGGSMPYLFSVNQNPFSSQSNYSQLPQGNYIVSIQDDKLCVVNDTITIIGPPSPLTITSLVVDVPCFETNTGSIDIQLSGGWQPYSFNWSNPSFTSLQLTQLGVTHETISVSDARGCALSKQVDLEQLLCCKAIIPNAFSPNGDSKNDVLSILPISAVSDVDLKIFNRWGQLVFGTKDINKTWDGTFKGDACEIGSYFYLFSFKCPFQEKRVMEKGDITLVR